jgi:hypothetical protein
LQVKVIHAFKRLEEINRDIVELNKLKDRISDERNYSEFLKDSFQREIEKISLQKEELLNLKVVEDPKGLPASKTTGTGFGSNVDGRKLYAEKENKFREEKISEAPTKSKPPIDDKSKKKPEKVIYKY